MPDYAIRALFVLVGALLIHGLGTLMAHTPRAGLRLFLGSLAGLAALLVGNTVGALFGVSLGLNALTLPVAVTLGVPGVGLMWAVLCLL